MPSGPQSFPHHEKFGEHEDERTETVAKRLADNLADKLPTEDFVSIAREMGQQGAARFDTSMGATEDERDKILG